MSVLCRVCHVFPPHVSIFGLFPVLVSCHYELSMFQLCLSRYVLINTRYVLIKRQPYHPAAQDWLPTEAKQG